MEVPIRALVGLGNPGPEHARQRHNVGFWLADALAADAGEDFRVQRRLKGWSAQFDCAGVPLRLFKPATFMNRSGEAVGAFAAYYHLDSTDLLIVHDDLDLPTGTIRLKRGGGHGGHNGLRDLHRVLGADYARLRIGIGHPGHKDRVLGYVLGAPGAEEAQALAAGLERAVAGMELMLGQGWDKAVQYLHTEQG
ncbi:MAG: aminoacyl-tRNA hydrolase [Salinisphaera sp.]|nr:aminoacyl-tRNA hydrolase [Salinisphaera sp.]